MIVGESEAFLFSRSCHVAAIHAWVGSGVISTVLVACGMPLAGRTVGTTRAETVRVERRALAMGTRVEVIVEADDRGRAVAASQAALDVVTDTERRLSTWRDDSELSLLNTTPVGSWAALSAATSRELSEALVWAEATGGAFDPTVGALVRAWDLRGAGRVPSEDDLRALRRRVGHAGLEVSSTGGRRTIDGLEVEEGGFGKGAALRAATAAAVAAGARCVRVDLGGQWASGGTCEEVRLSVSHPADRSREIATFPWSRGSVATSGHSERDVTVNGVTVGHLLDPRTGRPAPYVGSVTVAAPDPLVADVVATALAVMGPDEGALWLRTHPDLVLEALYAFTLTDGGVRLLVTPGVADRIRTAPGVTVRLLARENTDHGPQRGRLESDLGSESTTPDDAPARPRR